MVVASRRLDSQHRRLSGICFFLLPLLLPHRVKSPVAADARYQVGSHLGDYSCIDKQLTDVAHYTRNCQQPLLALQPNSSLE